MVSAGVAVCFFYYFFLIIHLKRIFNYLLCMYFFILLVLDPLLLQKRKCGAYLTLIHENSSYHEVQLGEMTDNVFESRHSS